MADFNSILLYALIGTGVGILVWTVVFLIIAILLEFFGGGIQLEPFGPLSFKEIVLTGIFLGVVSGIVHGLLTGLVIGIFEFNSFGSTFVGFGLFQLIYFALVILTYPSFNDYPTNGSSRDQWYYVSITIPVYLVVWLVISLALFIPSVGTGYFTVIAYQFVKAKLLS